MEDLNDETSETETLENEGVDTAEDTSNGEDTDGPDTATAAPKNGKMARWTPEELEFLAEQKASGKQRKECIQAYFEKFGRNRSEASVGLKVPTTSRDAGLPTRPAKYPKPTRKGGAPRAPVVVPVKAKEAEEEPEPVNEPTMTPFMESMTHFMETFAAMTKTMSGARGALRGKDLDTYQNVTKHYLMTLVS